MMDGTFVTAFRDVMAEPTVETVNGKERLILPAGWTDQTPKRPTPSPLAVGTLTGLIHYVRADRDGLALAACLVHVQDPGLVTLLGSLEDEDTGFRRRMYLAASTALVGPSPLPFGQYVDAETFVVALQAGFVETPDRDVLLHLVASIKESKVRETVDTGVAQEVTVAGGVVLVGTARVPNPVTLKPWRTFREIDQPASRFILRLRSGKDTEKPALALFEADGGAWKLEAVRAVAAYLRAALGETVTVIA